MYSFLQFTPVFSENVARFYFRQLIEGIKLILSVEIKRDNLSTPSHQQLFFFSLPIIKKKINFC